MPEPILVGRDGRVIVAPAHAVDDERDRRRRLPDREVVVQHEKIRREGYSLGRYVRWILLREPLVMASIMLKILLNTPNYRDPNAVPLAHEWRYVRYHWRLFRAITGALLLRPFSGGKIVTQKRSQG